MGAAVLEHRAEGGDDRQSARSGVQHDRVPCQQRVALERGALLEAWPTSRFSARVAVGQASLDSLR